jgi:DNA-3-methyladenine glycosylase
MPLDRSACETFFRRPADEVAQALIGTTLLVDNVGGIVVETEAYDHEDPASHSFRGRTSRNAAMFGPPGRAYVYRSEPGSAVLIRALQPVAGIEIMRQRRGTADIRKLCNGPGNLCQALGITVALDGWPLDKPPFAMLDRDGDVAVSVGRRVGITKGAETPWRFGLANSAFLSRAIGR